MTGRIVPCTPIRFDTAKESDHHLVVDIVDQLIVLWYLKVRQAGWLLFIERARWDHLFWQLLLVDLVDVGTYPTLESGNFRVCRRVKELVATELSLDGQAVRQLDLIILMLLTATFVWLLAAGEDGCG